MTTAPQAPDAFIGMVLDGRLKIRRSLGSGKFAYVYEAKRADGGRVAVKFLYRDDAQAVRRFDREIKVMQELPANEGCVGYRSHGRTPNGIPWLAMEFVDGFTLTDVTRSGRRLAERAACTLMAQLCDGFRGLHKLGLTHRDINPTNIMLTHRDRRVKLMDFGLVQDSQGLLKLFEERDLLGGSDFADDLDKGLIAGTPEYMAPEQIRDPQAPEGSQQLTDTTADVFALGAIFYQLISGRQLFPFAEGSGGATGRQGLINYLRYRTDFSDAQLICPEGVGAELWSIIRKSLARAPQGRQRDASELGADVRFYLETGQGVLDDDLSATIAQELDADQMRALIMTTGQFRDIKALVDLGTQETPAPKAAKLEIPKPRTTASSHLPTRPELKRRGTERRLPELLPHQRADFIDTPAGPKASVLPYILVAVGVIGAGLALALALGT